MQNFVLNMKAEGQEDYYDRDHAKSTEERNAFKPMLLWFQFTLASKFSLPTLKQKKESSHPTGTFFAKKFKLLLS